jgi:putative ABC transport system ATP-binding protein
VVLLDSVLPIVEIGPMRAESIVTVRDLRKSFGPPSAQIRALRGLDLTIGRGEFVALVGPSGCGKSTLLHVVAGLEPADSGEVIVDGVRMTALGTDARARLRRGQIGYVFQFFNLVDRMTARENVALAALVAGIPWRVANEHAGTLLDLLGLADKAEVYPPRLSGGLRQRLAIARACANRPSIVLADEPTGALDSAGGADVLRVLRQVNESGQSILVVTHDPAVASAADRVVEMRDGRVGQHAAVGGR